MRCCSIPRPDSAAVAQVKDEAAALAEHCGAAGLRATALTAEGGAAQRQQLASAGQLVVATPGRVAGLLKSGALHPRILARNLEVLAPFPPSAAPPSSQCEAVCSILFPLPRPSSTVRCWCWTKRTCCCHLAMRTTSRWAWAAGSQHGTQGAAPGAF